VQLPASVPEGAVRSLCPRIPADSKSAGQAADPAVHATLPIIRTKRDRRAGVVHENLDGTGGIFRW
jgi:hypothetical protein